MAKNKENSMQNLAPWSKPLDVRKKELLSALRSGKKIALMLYPDVDLSSSFRYRGYNVYQATKTSKKWQLIYFFPTEIKTVFELLPQVSLLIFGRFTKWSIKFDELVYQAHQYGIKVVLDLDDCVCGTDHIKEMFNVVSPDVVDQDYWINASAHLELIAQMVDGFIVTNDYLGKIISTTHEDKPYRVIKNFLNDEQIAQSFEILKNKAATSNNKDFTIGYFSGSHTHATDFEVVYPELMNVLEEHSDIKLHIVGILKMPASASKFLKNGQIKYTPFTDFLTLQKLIADVSLNIVPLADNVFTNCKSDLKFFEAGLVKTPTIASPAFAFKQSVEHGVTGLICRPGEWHDTIIKLYQNPEFAQSIAEKAYDYSVKYYSPTSCLPQIKEVFDYYAK